MAESKLYAVIWGVLFFTAGSWLVSIDMLLATILGYLSYVLCSMCIVSLFK